MTQLDQFESVFRAASKAVLEYQRIAINSVLVVTDQEGDAAGGGRAVGVPLRPNGPTPSRRSPGICCARNWCLRLAVR